MIVSSPAGSKSGKILSRKYEPYTAIEFKDVERQAGGFADAIETRLEGLVDLLLEYESAEVAHDEIERTLDLLKNLRENEEYFKLRIGAVAAFLPRNQPLYAFACFVIVPSLMASEVHFRIPHSMRRFFPKVLKYLDVLEHFPNIFPSDKGRLEFLKERTALLVDPATEESRPVTEAVIFTGTSAHADQLRLVFDPRTLFITNGSGHNPVVVGVEANIPKAVEAALTLGLYNQGQDCAAPNAILVHSSLYREFMDHLYSEFSKVKIGPYKDPSCRVGPLSNPEDLKHIEGILVDNRHWLDEKTAGIIRTAEGIVEPTIVTKPLEEGGNYEESFAPILFIQKYEKDEDLRMYFEEKEYSLNAMYVTLYGESDYVQNLIGREIDGKILHHPDTFHHNRHLHERGVERGTEPYGGYGRGASSISINGRIQAIPTLPQRDIFELVAKPLLSAGKMDMGRFTVLEEKNVEKKLRMRSVGTERRSGEILGGNTYIDLEPMKSVNSRFSKLEVSNLYRLLDVPNVEYISRLSLKEIKMLRSLKELLASKKEVSAEEFTSKLYALPKESGATDEENSARQLSFFKNIYQLLFGKEKGPRLGVLLSEVDDDAIDRLLDI